MVDPLKKKVLIVENDEDIRHIVGLILELEGYVVAGCTYSMENLINMDADLILLDEWVNQKEGHMLCKEIKAIKKLAHIPVIIFSTAEDIAEIAVTCKADSYVNKPFDMDILIDEVRKLLPSNHLYVNI